MTSAGAEPQVPFGDIYRLAARIKMTDERLRELTNKGRFLGFFYSPRGQEVLAAAVGACLREDDLVVTTYRGLHDQIAKGVPLPALLAEMWGKDTGACRGKGGPMHICDPDVGLMVTTGIVGAGLPIAVGLGLSLSMQKTDRVVAVNFGDGATNIGAFHEAMNLAAVWSVPVIFVCQNNEYGEYTPRLDSQKVEISARAGSYGMPGIEVDGNDAEAMYTAMSEAVARARRGEGPTLLDCRTFRFMGHFYGESQLYMDRDELARRMADDPVDRLRASIVAAATWTEAALSELELELAAEIDAAFEFALASPDPAPEQLLSDVLAGGVA